MSKTRSKFVILFGIIALLAFCHSDFAAPKSFDNGIDYLADRITSDMGRRNIQYIAVVDFTDCKGCKTVLNRKTNNPLFVFKIEINIFSGMGTSAGKFCLYGTAKTV